MSSFSGAAAALNAEYTLPGVSQTLIISRMAGRTPGAGGENLAALARHGASLVLFLSSGLLEQVQEELLRGGYGPETPAAIVYKATWPEEKVVRCTVATLAQRGREENIRKTALLLIGDFLDPRYQRSKLYDPTFATEFRPAQAPGGARSMRGGLAFLAFTDRGFALAQKLAEALGGSAARCGRPDSLGEWTKRHFAPGSGAGVCGGRWALPCGPSPPMWRKSGRTRRWWRWTSARISPWPCSPGTWGAPTTWPGPSAGPAAQSR